MSKLHLCVFSVALSEYFLTVELSTVIGSPVTSARSLATLEVFSLSCPRTLGLWSSDPPIGFFVLFVASLHLPCPSLLLLSTSLRYSYYLGDGMLTSLIGEVVSNGSVYSGVTAVLLVSYHFFFSESGVWRLPSTVVLITSYGSPL